MSRTARYTYQIGPCGLVASRETWLPEQERWSVRRMICLGVKPRALRILELIHRGNQ